MMDEQGEAMSAMVQASALYVEAYGAIDVMPDATPPPPPPLSSETDAASAAAKAQGADRPPTPKQSAKDVVDVDVEIFDEQTIEVTLNIAKGYHLNCEDAPPPLVPTKLEFESEVLTVKQIDYPWGTTKPGPAAVGEAAERVFEDEVSIVINLRARNDQGTKAKIVLQYQPCDQNSCLPPVTKTFDLDLPRMPENRPPEPSKVE